ncbi:MAG: pantoate kinase [Nitrosopumilaceae archaeon]
MKGQAFCPGHVTGFFKAEIEREKPEYQGSMGAGFSIKEGVTTRVEIIRSDKCDFKIEVNGYRADNTLVSEFVIKEFLKLVKNNFFIDVVHEISVPVGYGLGSSGAVALSLSLALNQAMNLGLSKTKVGLIAHNAEIQCKTGLGDVLSSFYGGFEIRTKQGAPGIGKLQKINSNRSAIIICFSPISTKKFMNEKMDAINGLGEKMVNKLMESKSNSEFLDMSLEFAEYAQMITQKMYAVIHDLHRIGIKCGVALFGETVFTLVSKSMEAKVLRILRKHDGIVLSSEIDNIGARVAYTN